MSFIIKSTGDQRTVTTASRSNTTSSLRDELVEALRGLTIKFELKVSDIFIEEGDNKSQTSKIGDEILAHIKDKIRAEGLDQTRNKEQGQERLEELQRLKEQECIREQAREKAVERAQEQDRKKGPTYIRPLIGPCKTYASPEKPRFDPMSHVEAIEASGSETKQAEQIAPGQVKIVPKTTAKYTANKLLEIKNSMAGEKLKATPPVVGQGHNPKRVITGRLRVGSIIKTGCIWVDQDNTPFITYDNERLTSLTAMIGNIDVGSQPPVSSVDSGDIVLAQSKDDDSWYRALVEGSTSEGVSVYFFDWGLRETIELSRIRRLNVLELGLSKNPATAIKIKLTNPPGPLLHKFLECDDVFDLKVNSYDDSDESYSITILGQST